MGLLGVLWTVGTSVLWTKEMAVPHRLLAAVKGVFEPHVDASAAILQEDTLARLITGLRVALARSLRDVGERVLRPDEMRALAADAIRPWLQLISEGLDLLD